MLEPKAIYQFTGEVRRQKRAGEMKPNQNSPPLKLIKQTCPLSIYL